MKIVVMVKRCSDNRVRMYQIPDGADCENIGRGTYVKVPYRDSEIIGACVSDTIQMDEAQEKIFREALQLSLDSDFLPVVAAMQEVPLCKQYADTGVPFTADAIIIGGGADDTDDTDEE